jgi:plasmid stability protein
MKTPSTLQIRPFPPELHRLLKIAAAKERKPMHVLVTRLLKKALEGKESSK